MNAGLSSLNPSDREMLYKGPLLVCILIAGADGKIDNKEVNEAVQMAREQHWVKSVLTSFYSELATDFEDKIKIVIQSYPFEFKKRNTAIIAELTQINSLWPKLSPDFSKAYYDMLQYLAHRIASSSGSFWGKITSEEARLVDLPMLQDPSKI